MFSGTRSGVMSTTRSCGASGESSPRAPDQDVVHTVSFH